MTPADRKRFAEAAEMVESVASGCERRVGERELRLAARVLRWLAGVEVVAATVIDGPGVLSCLHSTGRLLHPSLGCEKGHSVKSHLALVALPEKWGEEA